MAKLWLLQVVLLLENYYSGTLSDPAWRTLVQQGTIKADEVYVVGHDKQTYNRSKRRFI